MTLASPTTRFYLTGRVTVEGQVVVDQAALPGRQGRLALVYLVTERSRPVPVDELADALWGEQLPTSWEPSLRVVVSKVRTVLERAGAGQVVGEGGCYQALLRSASVDTEEAANALDRAEGAQRRGDVGEAWSEATVAASIARRQLLPGEDLPWIAASRVRLEALAVRALDVLAEVNLERGDHRLAAAAAHDLIALAPYREAGYRHLMQAEAAGGDHAEALRVFERLRDLLDRDLGARPDPRTRRLSQQIMASVAPETSGSVSGSASAGRDVRRHR